MAETSRRFLKISRANIHYEIVITLLPSRLPFFQLGGWVVARVLFELENKADLSRHAEIANDE